MTLGEFVTAVTEKEGTYDGNGVIVLIEPASGCRLNHDGHPEVVADQTPERIQFYGDIAYAQYQRFEDLTDLNISNVTFKLVPPEEEILFCGAWNTTQTTAYPDKLDAELQTENTGAVTFTNCVFENVAVSPISSTTAVTFTDCSFSGLGGYAIKDVKAAKVTVTGCSFSDCSGGVYMNGGGTVSTTYTDNLFTDIGTRGAIQFGNSGSYTSTQFSITGNTFTAKDGESSGFLRQLNDTISRDKIAALISDNTIPEGMEFTADSKTTSFELPEGCDFPEGTTVFDGETYYATMKEALEGIHNTDTDTLWCKPGADVGTLTHGHVCSDLTIYGNGAYISGGERDFELDTYTYCHNTSDTCDGITADTTLNIYNLTGAAVWGQRTTAYTLNIYLEGCEDMNRVYISGATGENNITLKNCTFDGTQEDSSKKANTCTVYSNAAGTILIDGCTFTGVNEPINLNNKAASGTQSITVSNCVFTDCSTTDIAASVGDVTWAAPIRVLSSEGAVSNLTVEACAFSYTDGKTSCNGDILLGDGRTGKTSYPVYATISGTDAQVQIQNPGDRTESENNARTVQVTAGEQALLSNVAASIGDKEYTTLAAAMEAAADGDTVKLVSDVTMQDGIQLDKGAGVSITLDLNGKTYTVLEGSNINYRGFQIVSGTLNVVDSSADQSGMMIAAGSGTTSSDGTGAYGVFRVETGGTLNVTGVTLKNSRPYGLNVKVLGGTATLTDVTIISSYGGGIEVTEANLGTQSQAGIATLTNCTVIQTGYFDHCSSAVAVSGGSKLIVNSGSYTSEGTAIYVFSSGGEVEVNGGTFSGGKYAVRAEIDTETYPEYEGSVQIKDGSFAGAFLVTEPATLSISGGYYTNNPAAYVDTGYGVVTETNVIDGVTYYYTVAESNVTVDTVVSAGTPDVSVDESLGLSQDFASDLSSALAGTETVKSLTDAAVGLSNDAGVVGTEEAAEKALTDAGINIESATVTVVVEPYLKVEVTGYDQTEGTLTLDISAYYNVKATTDAADMTESNTVLLQKDVEMTVTTPVTITIPLPTGFAGSSTLYVKHVKESGRTYYHLGTVSNDNDNDSLTFTNTKGFSTFTVLSDSTVVIQAELDGVYYDSLQDAVNDAVDGQTVTVLADGLSASVTGSDRTITVKNGTTEEITVTLNGTELTLGADESSDFTYTAPTGGGSSVTTYSVSVGSTVNGSVTVSPKNASKGGTVTITVTPDTGYVLDSLTATDASGNTLTLTDKGNGKYTFTMPASKVTVTAVFRSEDQTGLPFTDVAESAWYYDAVAYVYEAGVMTGTNDGTTFSPTMELTRGMMAQILYNLEEGTAGAAGSFTDVAADAWYADAVNWAASNGIVSGYGNGTFGPEDPITREQMAVLLYNYASYKGEELSAAADLSGYSDGGQVSDWAEAAMQWVVAEGLMQGSSNALNPLGTATRAEVAQLFMNLLER